MKWDPPSFEKVDWNAHKLAFKKHNRIHRISICKLIHGLYHTRHQDNKFYGTTDSCPCCSSASETLDHALNCPAPLVKEQRQNALSQLITNLDNLRTPQEIVAAIEHGLLAWASSHVNPDYAIRAPTRGSVKPTDIILTQAFHEQTSLGWNQFLRGRISKKWGSAFQTFQT